MVGFLKKRVYFFEYCHFFQQKNTIAVLSRESLSWCWFQKAQTLWNRIKIAGSVFLDDGPRLPPLPLHPHCVAAYLWRFSSHRETENCSVTAQTPASPSTAKTWQNQDFFWPFLIKLLSPEMQCSCLNSWRGAVRPGITTRPILSNEPSHRSLGLWASFKTKNVLLAWFRVTILAAPKKNVVIPERFWSFRKTFFMVKLAILTSHERDSLSGPVRSPNSYSFEKFLCFASGIF